MKVDTIYDIMGIGLVAMLVGYTAVVIRDQLKNEPVEKPRTQLERVLDKYDTNGNGAIDGIIDEGRELKNLLEDYQPRGEQ